MCLVATDVHFFIPIRLWSRTPNYPPPTYHVGCCLVAMLLLGGCRPNAFEQPDADPSALARVAADQIAYRISYDLETLTRRKLPEGAKPNAFELVEAMPTTRRNRVDLIVQQDGSVSFTSEKLTAEQQIGPQQYPDKLAKTVMQNGKVSFYDFAGKLLSQQDAPVQNMTPMLNDMRKAKKAKKNTNAAQRLLGGQDVEAMVELVKAKGGKVKDLDDSRVETELEEDLPTGKKTDENTPKRVRAVNRYDKKKGLAISADVFDAHTGKLLSHTLHTYKTDKASGQVMPHRVYTDSYYHDKKSGKTETRAEVATYKQFSFTDNLN